jgi:serine/threonine-protein kinase
VSAPSEDPTVAFPATRRARPRSRPTGSTAVPSIAPATAATTATVSAPLEALERDEIRRTRWFCYVAFVISMVAGGSLGWLHGDPAARACMLTAIAASAFATVFMICRTRDPVQFRRPSTGLGWVVIAMGASTAIPFFGAFSPAPVVLVLGIYFTSLGKSPRLAFVLYVVAASVQGGVGLLSILGLTRDIGLVQAGHLDLRQQLIIQGLVQFVFAITLVIGRLSRRAQQMAVEELEHEVRLSAHREALLIEAREQLERALRPGQGRFTGQQIGGYLLGSVLGRGAMGEVYEASGPGGPVAIKLLSQASLGNPNHVMRFFRELRTAAAIESPNVVKVLEVGDRPVPYLVMERLDGRTLSEILRSRRAMPVADVVDLVYQVGAGIGAAAAVGVVHRDLKPQNVFRHGEAWKVLDFGVARAADQGDTLTAGQIVGTPAYMAPEQASGGEGVPRADRPRAPRLGRSRRDAVSRGPRGGAPAERPRAAAAARRRPRARDRPGQAARRSLPLGGRARPGARRCADRPARPAGARSRAGAGPHRRLVRSPGGRGAPPPGDRLASKLCRNLRRAGDEISRHRWSTLDGQPAGRADHGT